MSSAVLILRPFEFFLTQYKNVWRGSAVTTVVTPIVYLLALGVGLGVFVDRSADLAGGISYLEFVAPGAGPCCPRSSGIVSTTRCSRHRCACAT
jgi:lipooligosaccharide transport system permease protein